jgi:exocyst complex protein 7
MNYQRASWNKVLDCLKDAGLYSKGNVFGAVSKELKERFKRFNAAFEEVYRTQTTWTVPDCELREELRISITEKLLPAYRSFQGRYMNHWDSERHAEKYIKYTSKDLEKYLVELFEGSSGSMDHRQRSNSLPGHSPESLFSLIWSSKALLHWLSLVASRNVAYLKYY